MANFILLGAAGFVAQRHMEAIKVLGHKLIAAVDPCDSVGILDKYFPDCEFFRSRFDVPPEITRTADYAVSCTPNAQHALDAWWAMDAGMDVIIEKPATISTHRLEELQRIEQATGKKCWCIMQMRLHFVAELLANAAAIAVKKSKTRPRVDIFYSVIRGPWYQKSWKADKQQSGGVLFNIGIHVIDLCNLIFGPEIPSTIARGVIDPTSDLLRVGYISFEKAFCSFEIGVCRNATAERRLITLDGETFDFSSGFAELHTESYSMILAGRGFTLEDAKPSIQLCERLSADVNKELTHRQRDADLPAGAGQHI